MSQGSSKGRGRTVGLVLVAGLVGYLIGPPLVQAATNNVLIKDPSSARKARVLTGGALKVRPEGGFTTVFPGGVDLIQWGSGMSEVCSTEAVITEIVVNGGGTSADVSLSLEVDGTGRVDIWAATVPADGRVADAFGYGLFVPSLGEFVTMTPVDSWFVYGICFDDMAAAGLGPLREALER